MQAHAFRNAQPHIYITYLYAYIYVYICDNKYIYMHLHIFSFMCAACVFWVCVCASLCVIEWVRTMHVHVCARVCTYERWCWPLLPAPSLRMHACALTCARAHTRAKPIVVWCIWYTSACIHVSMHIRIIMHLQPWHVYLYMIYMICMLLYTHMYIHACNVCMNMYTHICADR